MQTQLVLSDANFIQQALDKSELIQRLSGNVAWQSNDLGWQLIGDDIDLTMHGVSWQQDQFRYVLTRDDEQSEHQLSLNYLRL